jgi:hypothetical protein
MTKRIENWLCMVGVFAIVIAGACFAVKFVWDMLTVLFQFYN